MPGRRARPVPASSRLLTCLHSKHGATPATVVADVPTEFATATGIFAPVNYNRHCYGPMRYRVALANSLNISAVKVLASIGGPEPLQQLLQQCGLTTLGQPAEHYGLGLTIGNAEVRLLELANAYASLARLGQYRPYRLLLDGACPPARQVADPAAAYLIADILSDNEARTLAFGAESALRFAFPVACKTGTSSDFRDNWAFGYAPEFTVGVWVGNFDGSPMEHVSGVTGAAPILHDIFEHLHARYGTTWYAAPANIVECWINPITGKRLNHLPPRPGPDAMQEKFLAANLPPLESPADYTGGGTLWPRPAGKRIPGMVCQRRQLAWEPRRARPRTELTADQLSAARHDGLSRSRPAVPGPPAIPECPRLRAS